MENSNVEIYKYFIDSNSFQLKREKENLEELKNKTFRIPLYQRPYEWKQEETRKLLEDIWNAKEKNEKHFIGNIIVEENREFLDVIDGQQRFTTIYLISKLLEKDIFNFEYEIRDEVKRFFEELNIIFKDNTNKLINELSEFKKKKAYQNIADIQRIIENMIEILKFCKEKGKGKYKEILEELLKHIEFSITFLQDVDATKYFEVMNLRGKQLENHQVLKAKILKVFENDKEKLNLYSQIWDYCSKFDNYIWELVGDRKSVPNLNKFLNFVKSKESEKDIENIKNLLGIKFELGNKNSQEGQDDERNKQSENNQINILDIIKGNISFENNKEISKEKDEKYSSIIKKYSIFLLHVLRIYLAKEKGRIKEAKNVPLDELKLIEIFTENLLKDEKKSEKVEKFLQLLLKLRILFDYFIFKRAQEESNNGEKIHLKAFEKIDKDNKNKLIMIELLFELTSGGEQNWLTAALGYLIRKFEEDKQNNNYNQIAEDFFDFLEELDKAFMTRRLYEGKDFEDVIFKVFELDNLNKVNFEEFINDQEKGELKKENEKENENENKNESKNKNENENDIQRQNLKKILNQGCNTPHYFFYKVEYLLWKNRENYFCDENLKNICKNSEYQKRK